MTVQDYQAMPVEQAIREIITAQTMADASHVRNEVAFAALKKLRPQRDADACNEAFFDRWGVHVRRQQVGTMGPLHWTGD